MDIQNNTLNQQMPDTAPDIEDQQIISLTMFCFLCVISWGAYEVWWIYKAWRFYQQKEKSDIMPAVRAIFSIFFLYSLFEKILAFAREKGYTGSYSSALLLFGFILGNLIIRLPEPYWLISIISYAILIPPFNALNYAKRNSKDFVVTEQTSFSGRQIGVIVVGAILWALVLLGMALGDVSQEEDYQ